MKKTRLFTVIITAILVAAVITGCGNNNNTTDNQTPTTEITEVETIAPETLDETDQAVVDAGLQVDEQGNITDENGNKVEVNENGKVEVKTEDGNTVEVDTSAVKAANEHKTTVYENNKAANANNATSNKATTNNQTDNQTNNTTKNNTTNSNTNTNNKTNNSSTTNSNTTTKTETTTKPSTKTDTKTQPATVDPHAGKTWHEAVYKTVNHPEETSQVWVVDVAAHTEEEPVYAWRTFCNVCGADITENCYNHMEAHALAGEGGRYHDSCVQVGTNTVNVPEEGHYETVVVKKAWTEKVLVKEAGWY